MIKASCTVALLSTSEMHHNPLSGSEHQSKTTGLLIPILKGVVVVVLLRALFQFSTEHLTLRSVAVHSNGMLT